MIERVKSIVLTALILLSLLLSGLLLYTTPNVEEMNRKDYIPQQLIGEERQLEALVQPRSIVYHNGKGRHYMAFAGDRVYDAVTASMPDWQFAEAERKKLTPMQWEQLMRDAPGWELRYPASIPAALFSEQLLPHMEPLDGQLVIDRIWVYRQHDEMKALFISDFENSVFECTLVTADEEDIFAAGGEVHLLAVTPLVETSFSGNAREAVRVRINYLPQTPQALSAWSSPLKEIDLEQMKNLLFLDPTLVRTVADAEEGAIILQDGTRSLRYEEDNRLISYQNFKMKLDTTAMGADLLEAVQFINHHGGWMADYQLVEADAGTGDDNVNHYRFRLLKDGFPVYDHEDKDRYGTLVAVESKGGVVLRYDRSLHFTAAEEDSAVRKHEIAGGEAERNRLRAQLDLMKVRDMFPAYRAVPGDGELHYVPDWRIQLTNGDELWFEALDDEGGEADGLEQS